RDVDAQAPVAADPLAQLALGRRRMSGVPETLAWRLARFAAFGVLVVTPFRSSAGLRGALLLLAAFLILWSLRGGLAAALPRARLLGTALALWFMLAFASALMGPEPLNALQVVKRDILTPTLAFLVFHALTREARDLRLWSVALAIGLMVLTLMALHQPFDPKALTQELPYLGVGWLTAWLITIAPVFALLALNPDRGRWRTALLVLAAAGLLLSAWASGSRTVWACFALMALVVVGIAWQVMQRQQHRRLLVSTALGLTVIGAAFWASLEYRAATQAREGETAIAFLMADHRVQIWHEAMSMISERPWTGQGYGTDGLHEAFRQRFSEPWFRAMVQQPHNVLLNAALQMGWPGALLLLGLFGALFQAFWVRAIDVRADESMRLAAACGVALVAGVFLRNMTDDFLSRHGVLALGAVAGMLYGLARRPTSLPVAN
ncbi:MAG TPA: O-antigen ligase family protein, partial [Usitatibacteraceae bacterium]|nr:O-antigen ligase family protein [Usitatibacteraceae bacterium]